MKYRSAFFGSDAIVGPNLNRTDSGYYPTYPMIRNYGFEGYKRIKVPSKEVAEEEREDKIRGFKLRSDCKGFIILNKWSAFRWAYQLGLFYRIPFGSIDDHLYKNMDISKKCLEFLQSDYKKQFSVFTRKDIQFYMEIIYHYFKGLIQGGKIPYEVLKMRFDSLMKLAVQYGIKPRTVGMLYPAVPGIY